MADYDLTGSLKKEFTFNIGEEVFRMRKPTVREMRELVKKFGAIERETDPDMQTQRSDEAMAAVYEYITPVDGGREIDVALEEQTVEVQLKFNDMITKELGAKK